MARPKKIKPEEAEAPPVEEVLDDESPKDIPVEAATMPDPNAMAVMLSNGKMKLGTKVVISGAEHVEIKEGDHSYLVHKSPKGDWYEV